MPFHGKGFSLLMEAPLMELPQTERQRRDDFPILLTHPVSTCSIHIDPRLRDHMLQGMGTCLGFRGNATEQAESLFCSVIVWEEQGINLIQFYSKCSAWLQTIHNFIIGK